MGRPAKISGKAAPAVHLFDLPDPGEVLQSSGAGVEDSALFSNRSKPQQGMLKRLSARHHRLAQCLAEGIPPGEAGIICGYAGSRVSVLQNDAAFRELVSFYTAARQEAFVETGEKLATLASTAIDILQDRLEETPDEFNPSQLLAVVQTAADRSGHGPASTQRNLNVTLSADDLERLRGEALSGQLGRVKIIPAQSGSESGKSGLSAPDAKAEEPSRPEGTSV